MKFKIKLAIILFSISILSSCSINNVNLRTSDMSPDVKIGVYVTRCRGAVGYLSAPTSIASSLTGDRYTIRNLAESTAKKELEDKIISSLSEIFKGTIVKKGFISKYNKEYALSIKAWACPAISVKRDYGYNNIYKSNIELHIKAVRSSDRSIAWEALELYSSGSYISDLEEGVGSSIERALNRIMIKVKSNLE